MRKLDLRSEHALLDVPGKKRCASLESHLEKHGPVEVIIRATIVDTWGAFDGMSQEFELEVSGVELSPPNRTNP